MNDVRRQPNDEQIERRAFQLHKDILWPIIKSQAGTLGKAILELVQNSIDAGATSVHIDLSPKRLKVVDDGRGFQSRDEIVNWFETFGTPHKEGDARYGKFRMGRGQAMAFTRNSWRSGHFAMHVDIRDLGLEYDLKTLDEAQPGCTIDAELYEPLHPSEFIRTCDELRDLCKYTPVPVLLGQEQISLDPETQPWTFVDEDAYYLLKAHSTKVEAYNLGVFVRGFWHGDFGIGGVVVSKKQLNVNFARNDVIVAECQVWRRISAAIRAYAKSTEEKRPAQNDAFRELTLQRLLTGGFDSPLEFAKSLDSAKLFTDYSGKHYTLGSLTSELSKRGRVWAVPADFSLKADRAHQMKMGLIISPKMLERARNLPMADVLRRLRSNLANFSSSGLVDRQNALDSYTIRRLEMSIDDLLKAQRPIEELTAAIKEDHHAVEDKKLSKVERAVVQILNSLSYLTAAACKKPQVRVIKACESETVEAYTDGKTVIFVNRKLLTIPGTYRSAYKAFDYLRTVLVHEYCHDHDDSTGHGHPPEFFEAFHDALGDPGVRIGEFAYEAIRQYARARKRDGLPLRAAEMDAFDMDDASGSGQVAGTNAAVAAGSVDQVSA